MISLWPSLRGQRDWAQAEEARNKSSRECVKDHPNMCEESCVCGSNPGTRIECVWEAKRAEPTPLSVARRLATTEKNALEPQASYLACID